MDDEDAPDAGGAGGGAEDVVVEDEFIEVHTEPGALHDVREKLVEAGYSPTAAEPRRIPSNVVEVSGETAEQLLKLLDALEDHDDVQAVSSNFDMSEEVYGGDAGLVCLDRFPDWQSPVWK